MKKKEIKPDVPRETPAKRPAHRPVGTGFHPTQEQRNMVELACGLGIPEKKMVVAILHPKTGKHISHNTLLKHFRDELDRGLLMSNLKAGGNFLNLTESSATAGIFWLKTRMGWKEKIDVIAPLEPELRDADENMKDSARRVAFCLAMGASLVDEEVEKPVKPKTKTKDKARA